MLKKKKKNLLKIYVKKVLVLQPLGFRFIRLYINYVSTYIPYFTFLNLSVKSKVFERCIRHS